MRLSGAWDHLAVAPSDEVHNLAAGPFSVTIYALAVCFLVVEPLEHLDDPLRANRSEKVLNISARELFPCFNDEAHILCHHWPAIQLACLGTLLHGNVQRAALELRDIERLGRKLEAKRSDDVAELLYFILVGSYKAELFHVWVMGRHA